MESQTGIDGLVVVHAGDDVGDLLQRDGLGDDAPGVEFPGVNYGIDCTHGDDICGVKPRPASRCKL